MRPNMSGRIEIRRLASALADEIAAMFARICADPDAARFHPHAFDDATARSLCALDGRDLYFCLLHDSRALGYGILRGWDDGWPVPSLGIWIDPALRGTGAARLLMAHLHLAAALAGAERIRLKVYQDNPRARELYERLGYVFDGNEAGQAVGQLALATRGPIGP